MSFPRVESDARWHSSSPRIRAGGREKSSLVVLQDVLRVINLLGYNLEGAQDGSFLCHWMVLVVCHWCERR